MPELELALLGSRIRNARRDCGLTQKELAEQTGLAIKTVHDIEKGQKNPTYETLARLIDRLGISPGTLFLAKTSTQSEEIQYFLENFQLCDQKAQLILLRTLRFLAEQLHTLEDNPD